MSNKNLLKMNTISISPPRGRIRAASRNKFYFRVLISLTSGIFPIFVAGIGVLLCWLGACIGHDHLAGPGALLIFLGLAPHALRICARDLRQLQKLG